MDMQYEVLNPWAEADPIPLRGISPRVADLKGKSIGLFINHKTPAPLIQTVVEKKLKERYPTSRFSQFRTDLHIEVTDTEDRLDLRSG